MRSWFKTPTKETLFDLLPTEKCSTLLLPFTRLMERTTGARYLFLLFHFMFLILYCLLNYIFLLYANKHVSGNNDDNDNNMHISVLP